MGNRFRRELDGKAILRDMLAHPPRERQLPYSDLSGALAVIGAYDGPRVYHFCEGHRGQADNVFERA